MTNSIDHHILRYFPTGFQIQTIFGWYVRCQQFLLTSFLSFESVSDTSHILGDFASMTQSISDFTFSQNWKVYGFSGKILLFGLSTDSFLEIV
jgi:hypothetical protein